MGMHADGEAYLMQKGSKQKDLWGINLHPSDYGTDDFIGFDSIDNLSRLKISTYTAYRLVYL